MANSYKLKLNNFVSTLGLEPEPFHTVADRWSLRTA